MSEKLQSNWKLIAKWVAMIGIPILILLVPVSEPITTQMKIYMAITIFGILTFVLEPFTFAVGGIIMMTLYVVTGIAPFTTAFGSFSQAVPWTVFGCFLLLNIVQNHTNLIERIAYICLIKTGGTYKGIIFGIICLGIVINLIIPGVFTAMAIAALAYGICQQLDLGKSKASSGIMMAGILGFLESWCFIYCPADMGVLVGAANNIIPLTMDYFTHLKYGLVYLPVPFLTGLLIMFFCKPEKEINGKAYFVEKQKELGPMGMNEKKVLGVLLLFAVYLFTFQWHGMDMTYGFLIAPLLLYMPGLNIADKKDIATVDWPMIIFVASCISIGLVAGAVGIPQVISEFALPYLSEMSSNVFILVIYFFVVIFNFMMTPMAMVASFVAPVTQIAVDLGIDPYAVLYAFDRGCYNILLPYEAALVAAFVAFGNTRMDCFMKIWGTKIFLGALWLFLIACPYWKLIGIL